jgi:glycosyltransferase involved in cell wall biosynthesis
MSINESNANQTHALSDPEMKRNIQDLRTLSGNNLRLGTKAIGVISESQLDDYIRKFEDNYGSRIQAQAEGTDTDGPELYSVEEITTNPTNSTKTFMYFIGRLNPPHKGHISALVSLINTAKEKGTVPLILLGSGPGKVRTMDNPIDFETKKNFIETELAQTKYNDGEGFVKDRDYIITEMTNPAANVAAYVYKGLESEEIDPTNIQITHVAGDKGDDAEKLMFALNAGVAAAERAMPNVPVSKNVAAITAVAASNTGPAMSATIVRKDAYISLIDGSGYEGWLTKYGDFYGTNAEAIYQAILYPLNSIPEEERRDVIVNYIEHGKLPIARKPKKASSKARGVTKKKGRRTKSNTKNKNAKKRRQIRTHRKKRRTTSRK